MSDDVFDQLGDWSQIKHEILEQYAHAYTTIICSKPVIRRVLYIDAYAGSGYALNRDTGAQLPGSAVRAMQVTPAFTELHLVDDDPEKVAVLKQTTRADPRVTVHQGDAIGTLRSLVLPRCQYNSARIDWSTSSQRSGPSTRPIDVRPARQSIPSVASSR
jgi:three-Cys-motif partner protein